MTLCPDLGPWLRENGGNRRGGYGRIAGGPVGRGGRVDRHRNERMRRLLRRLLSTFGGRGGHRPRGRRQVRPSSSNVFPKSATSSAVFAEVGGLAPDVQFSSPPPRRCRSRIALKFGPAEPGPRTGPAARPRTHRVELVRPGLADQDALEDAAGIPHRPRSRTTVVRSSPGTSPTVCSSAT